jgi:hypothetical protein
MAVNEIRKQPKFCWWCYSESVQRAVAGLPRSLRAAVLAQAQAHKDDGGVVPTLYEHRQHKAAQARERAQAAAEAEAGQLPREDTEAAS